MPQSRRRLLKLTAPAAALAVFGINANVAGLRFRPLELTVKDSLAWYQAQLKEEKGRVKLAFAPEQEANVQAAWKEASNKAG